MSTLLEHVADFFRRHDLAGRPGVVAVSGGPDSVALGHVCATLAKQQRLASVVVAHLNHQLRGADSDADEAFVRNLPRTWESPELSCRVHRLDVARLARDTADNLENAGRQARYRWLTAIAQETGAAWVATGHTADDQAETILHHLLRGSGAQGLAGMPARRPLAPGIDLVRPLLTIRRATVMDYLEQHRLAYRHDASNDDLAFTRSRLRHELLPLLERDYNPRLVEVLGRTAHQLREVQDELTRQAHELLARVELPRAGTIVVLAREPLQAAPPLLVRELMRLTWQREGWPQNDMGFDDWDRAAALARGASAGNDFPDGVRVRAVGRVIQVERGGSNARPTPSETTAPPPLSPARRAAPDR
ncbi:MAG: tRNA lysidine(34) synthetase TilS [Gemmataceae bacterium]|nr:tRNA lysidine(34) synthetase TilS [Gemmataceae bacterium]